MSKLNALSLSSLAVRNLPTAGLLPSAAKTLPASQNAAGIARAATPSAARVAAKDTFDAGGIQGGRAVTAATALKDAFVGATSAVAQPAAQAPAQASAQAADGTTLPSATDTRPPGDKRSAADIVNDSPVLAHLGRQKDIKFDQLCKQTGVDPNLDLKDSRQNPDAVYRLSKVLEYIDSSKMSDGGDRSSKVQGGKGDGNIEGITKDGDARHGTEAGLLKDFAEKGYGALSDAHQLPTTSDTHVKADGSNKDNFQWFAGEVGKKLWFLPGISNVLTGIGNSEGGFLGALKGGLGGLVKTWKGVAEGVIGAFKFGRVNPLSLALGAYKGALGETDAAPKVVKDVVNLLP